MSVAISARALRMRYGSNEVLRGLDFDVTAGEIYGLLGPNGAGKSTLLRILAGAIRPGSGQVEVRGSTGYVSQTFSLYPDLTVWENVWFFARCHGAADAVRPGVQRVMARFGLEPRASERTERLSQGWKQRVSIAAALAHDPAVLLLDEATAGLDPVGRAELWRVMRQYAQAGTAIVLATHFTDEAALCHRTGYLDGGVLGPMPVLPAVGSES